MGARGEYLVPGQTQYQPAPNAALLIDFDNVTMSIRSDLGKEIKALLKSDVIRGKVAVQRAYADWRRYPQYIVPLTESSVDLIFAPAYGSSKKNATDLRMAIDAIELVFTRPEIGTFILMTGDSDFSSCVLKLKEYGKYVIGVGMRESSSDLLIQNCDEYYSYHSLSGLSRAGEIQESQEDPWVLVRRAVQQMVKNGDVMRTDRLKQVMLDLDPGFDEKKLGYSKFSRFVSEAAEKGLLQLKKVQNGQYEIVPEAAAGESAAKESREKVVERIVAEAEAQGNGRRRRGGRREERASERTEVSKDRDTAAAETEKDVRTEAAAPAEAAPPTEKAVAAGKAEPGPFVVSDLDQAYSLLQEALRQLTNGSSKAIRDGDVKRRMLDISTGFDESAFGFSKFTRFLRQAHDAEVIDLNRVGAGNYEVSLPAGGKRLPPPPQGEPVAEEVTVTGKPEKPTRTRGERGAKPAAEVAAAETGAEVTTEAPAARAAEKPSPTVSTETKSEVSARPVGGLRGRLGRAAPSGPPPILPGQVVQPRRQEIVEAAAAEEVAETASAVSPESKEPAAADTAPEKKRSRRGRGRGRGRAAAEMTAATEAAAAEEAVPQDTAVEAEQAAAAKPAAKPAAPAVGAEAEKEAAPVLQRTRARRGRRATAADEGPPPILEGQVVPSPRTKPATEKPAAEAPAKATAVAEPSEAEKAVTEKPAAKKPAARKAATRKTATKKPAAEKPVTEKAAPARKTARKRTEAAATSKASTAPAFSPADLDLPVEPVEIARHLSSYRGVGIKTAEAMINRFGTDVFAAMNDQADAVRELLGPRRAQTLLDQWKLDLESRSSAKGTGAKQSGSEAAAASAGANKTRTAATRRASSRTTTAGEKGRKTTRSGSKSKKTES